MSLPIQTLLFDRTAQQGRLEMIGRDRLDLLHRMSTNDLLSLKQGEGRPTVLTTAVARIIDRLIVYHRGDRALLLTNRASTVRNWLQKHIFFRDEVKLRDVSAELGQLELYGPQAGAAADGIAVGASALALHHFVEHESRLVARTFPLAGAGFLIIAPTEELAALKASILTNSAIALGDAEHYERLRVEAGLPGPAHELTEDYIPLEANLWDSVSFSKGCYIGQEIIARMESRNKLAKTLVELRLEASAPVGATLSDGERNVGTLTSVVTLDDGSIQALGFVKPDRAEAGTQLRVMPAQSDSSDKAMPISAQVTTAPLIQGRR